VDFLHAIHKESRWEAVKTPLREGGVLTTLWTGEWLVNTLPEGELVEAALAVMAAREHLWLGVVLMTAISSSKSLTPLSTTRPPC
jgi:hypothetical protein